MQSPESRSPSEPGPPDAPKPAVLQQPIPVAAQQAAPAAASSRPIPLKRPANGAPQKPAPAAKKPIPAKNATVSQLAVYDTDDDEFEDDQLTVAARTAPPWLISMVIHMAGMIVAAVIYLATPVVTRVNVQASFAEEEGEQLIMQNLEISGVDLEEQSAEFAKSELDSVDPLAAMPKLKIDFNAMNGASDIDAPTVGMELTGREPGMKKALLAAYGGTKTTEEAVRLGLEWLKKQQNRDGTWSLTGPYTDGGGIENRTAATAMALLAFQGAGHTHLKGEHRKVVEKGARALIKMQDKDGNFFQRGPNHHRLYSQAQASIAICELYGMTQDSELRLHAQRALDYAARIQSPEGGWRYEVRKDADTSVTGWFMMALQSGRMAGLELQSPTSDGISRFLDSVTKDGVLYAYQPDRIERPTSTMTAEALLCRQYLGWKRSDKRLAEGVEILLDDPIDWDKQNVYYWYYATQVLHHMGGKDWFEWNDVMRRVVPKHQEKKGRERGSWDPGIDKWGAHGGRLYETCLCLYMLEVYYRHLPIYKHVR